MGVALPVETDGVVWLQCGVPGSEAETQPGCSDILRVSQRLSETGQCTRLVHSKWHKIICMIGLM